MMTDNAGSPQKLSQASILTRVLASCVVIGGFAVLAAWRFDIGVIKRIRPEYPAMNPLTALSFILLGISLYLSDARGHSALGRASARFLALTVGAAAFIRLTGYTLGSEVRIDTIFFGSELGKEQGGFANRMALNSAILLFLSSVAIIFRRISFRSHYRPSELLGSIVLVASTVVLTGYAYDAHNLTQLGENIPMALNTAVGFVLLSTGILLTHSKDGLIRVFARRSIGGRSARKMVPASILILLLLGWVHLLVERSGLITSSFGTVLFAVAGAVLVTALIWYDARRLDAINDRRHYAENELAGLVDFQRALLDSAGGAIISVGLDGKVRHFNRTAEVMLGYRADELVGQLTPIIYHDMKQVERRRKRLSIKEAREVSLIEVFTLKAELQGIYTDEWWFIRRDGSRFVGQLTVTAIRDSGGASTGYVGVLTDVTARKDVEAELANYRDSLEKMVAERTHELEQTNLILEAEVAERQRSNDRIAEQVGRITALHTIDETISSTLDLKATLKIFLEQVVGQLKVDAAATLLLNDATCTLDVASQIGFNSPQGHQRGIPLGQGYAGHCAMSRKLVNVEDLRQTSGQFLMAHRIGAEGFVSYYAVPLITKGKVKGVLEVFLRRLFEPDRDWLDFLETLAGQAAIAIDNAELFDGINRSHLELEVAYERTLEGWVKALDIRDQETEGHSRRVTEASMLMAEAMGIAGEELVNIRRGALLHDIGKLGIPDSVLLKPGKLTEEEWTIMRKHPGYAYEWLLPITYLHGALDIPRCHHEKWDGSGYPRGLKGKDIPFGARIFAVIDVWDALRSDRPYRKGWSEDAVRAHIQADVGKHFDPDIVDVFMRMDFSVMESFGSRMEVERAAGVEQAGSGV